MRATGKSPTEFATVETFGDVIRASSRQIAARCEAAFAWLDREVRAFQAREGPDAYQAAKQLGGMRLVLGGGSRFLRSQLDSVSTAVLYSDTVLIPDPVMPWLEKDRREERFRHVLLLQAVHTLLHLKPLVDADLHYPPVVVFPSYEKLLEHEKELRLVQEKYNRVHGQTAVLAVAAAAGALIPALAPFLGGVAPLALGTKYGHDKIAEFAEKRTLTQSLVGVLAAAKSEG